MSRRKNKTTVELQAAADHVEQEIAKLLAQKKDLRKQINETSRKERNAHIYFRGGELTHHLGDKAELLTDEDIKLFLDYVFSFGGVQKIVNEMLAIRRGDAEGTMEELLSNAATVDKRVPIRNANVQTS